MISVSMMKAFQTFDDNDKRAKALLKICKELNTDKFNNICIVGWNSEIHQTHPKKNITVIEPTYYDFLENNNINYINKFCWKDNKTHFDLVQCDDPDSNYGVKVDSKTMKTPNTVCIDELGDFDLIIDLAINSYYEVLLGAERNLKENHPIVVHSLFSVRFKEIQDYLLSLGYTDSYFVKHNDNILVCYE